MPTKEYMAWYRYPEPDGQGYTAADLEHSATVEEVFDYCQILLAYVTARGWQHLLRHHGLLGLLEINRRSGWFDEADDVEAADGIKYHCLIAGYDPETDAMGAYNEQDGVFASHDGTQRIVQWGVSWSASS